MYRFSIKRLLPSSYCVFVSILLFNISLAQDSLHPGYQQLLIAAPDNWLTYHGDYSGQRHSPLVEITPDNVHTMSLAWAFPTNQPFSVKASPIVVDGIIYLSAPDNVWAIDARSGRQLWRYQKPRADAFYIGHRGVAVRGDKVFLTTPDTRLIALDRWDGSVIWDIEIVDHRKGYWSTNAPLLIRNHLIVGVSGDFDNLPGLLRSFDPETGELQWTYYSTPPLGTPDAINGNALGGQMWMTGTYDPELNLMYVGTGNPTPVLNGEYRPGDNKWTGSIVALNPDNGEMAWGFQVAPHDTHDWDAAEVPVLVDASFAGVHRKLLLQASRNGLYVVLDRETGENLLTTPFAALNWMKQIDADGNPVNDPAKDPTRAGVLVAPDEAGATNFRSPSFDPDNGILIVSAADAYGIYFFKQEHGTYGWAGADYRVHSKGELRAIDYASGEIRWRHDLYGDAANAGILTTASGITFTGDSNNNALALNTSTGETLWHAGLGNMGNPPVTFQMDGRQYVLLGGGSTLYAFKLP